MNCETCKYYAQGKEISDEIEIVEYCNNEKCDNGGIIWWGIKSKHSCNFYFEKTYEEVK